MNIKVPSRNRAPGTFQRGQRVSVQFCNRTQVPEVLQGSSLQSCDPILKQPKKLLRPMEIMKALDTNIYTHKQIYLYICKIPYNFALKTSINVFILSFESWRRFTGTINSCVSFTTFDTVQIRRRVDVKLSNWKAINKYELEQVAGDGEVTRCPS